MKIIIKTTNFELTPSLKKYIEEKLNILEKFVKIFRSEECFNHFFGKGKPRSEAWVEIGKTTLRHKRGPIFWAECQMRLPGKSIRSTAQSEDLKFAINEMKDGLQRELKQYKNKSMAQIKRRTRVLKKELHFSPRARFWRKGRIKEEGI